MEKVKFTIIIHTSRIKLDLSCNEYCIADIIYHLSNNPNNKINGWCYASKKTLAEYVGMHENTIYEIIEKLIKKELLEKDKETKYLKTTQKWFNTVIIENLKSTTKNVVRPQKGDTETTKNVVEAPQKGDTIYIIDNYKDNKNTPLPPKGGIEEISNFSKENLVPYKHCPPTCAACPANGECFGLFWQAYPLRVNKANTEKVWRKLKPDKSLISLIIQKVELKAKSEDWLKENGKFIPHPTTWLKGWRWEDEIKSNLTEEEKLWNLKK